MSNSLLINRRRIFVLLLVLGLGMEMNPSLSAQSIEDEPPKLIVGITVDQMRYDYITRFWDKYSEDGFKRLIKNGYFNENTHYDYAPTYTAPGHASIFTGTSPSVHGIIANTWYDKVSDDMMYCTQDTSVRTVGAPGDAGRMSPRNMLTSTIADQMKLASNFKSKSIAVSLKDRGAILAAGHSADAAYWYDSRSGSWITSTFYMDTLPMWVQELNIENQPAKWLSQPWTTLLPIEEYTESIKDNNPFEKPYWSGLTPTFPHQLDSLQTKLGPGLITATPFGNTITQEFAKRAIQNEELGKDEITDFLGVSFSSTDYVGHQFGPRSIELEDTYLRLDRDLADLVDFLNNEVGENEYLVFLSADHGAVETPLFLENFNIPAGYFNSQGYKGRINGVLRVLYGDKQWVKNISNDQVFLNHKVISESDYEPDEIISTIIEYSLKSKGVANAISSKDLITGNFDHSVLQKLQKGYNQKRSGDVHLVLEPGWIIYFRQGTTHGSPYTYDTHVPLIFYGKGVKKGNDFSEFNITDIAPSLAAYLHIQAPNGTTGKIRARFFE